MGKGIVRWCVVAAVMLSCLVVGWVVLPKPESVQWEDEVGTASSEDPLLLLESALSDTEKEEQEEMIGVWVPYFVLSMAGEQDKSESAFRQKFQQIVENAIAHGMNTLIVQVRPFGDAFYPSDYFPWSSYLTGTQGQDPGYDPLSIMVELSHAANLQLHAWVNPLRLQVNGVPADLAEDSLINLWQQGEATKDWCLPWAETDGMYCNPSVPEVRQYVADGVAEIVAHYDVDGIQFDDYFYPTSDPEFDRASYESYCAEVEGEPLSQLDWRAEQINQLVSLVYQTVKETDPSVVFGISPQGNVENDYNIGADVATWCSSSGYVDYICPQLYYNFENPYLPFDQAAEQWQALVTNSEIKLHFGLALYKASSDADEGTWKHSNSILAQQVELGRTLGCDGFLLYSYEQLNSRTAEEEVENVMAALAESGQ